jgi:two-component system, OmpR family, phosphate regulon sensor histidine kinase PhoR
MKQHSKYIHLCILLILLLFACFLIAAYIINLLFGDKITIIEALGQAVASFAGIAIFALLCLIIYIFLNGKSRKEPHKQSYHAFINEIEDSLDRISKGDFEIRIDKRKYRSAGYGSEHITELVNKINNMAKELGEMETMRQDFVSNVSHEIQSPLTSIKGFVCLLKDETLSSQDRLHYIAIIESESQRLSKLGENLLRLSILETESVELNPRTYSLSMQLKDVILLLEPRWSGKEMEISLNEEMVDIFADEELINQVWINLLNNSIKFTPDGGRITVSATSDSTQVMVAISDSGIGMTEETLTHIFERFYMADKARSRNAGGSGLGLSIVKRIVQMHHGKIDVESKLGEGTTFKISIPMKQSMKRHLNS